MIFSRHFSKDHNFMYTKIAGEINDQNLRQHVIDKNKETEGISNFRELADCREISCMDSLTVQGAADSADTERDMHDSLLAILVTNSTLLFGLARAYQTFAEDRRKSVEIFKDIDKALAWLANDEQEVDLLNEYIKKKNA